MLRRLDGVIYWLENDEDDDSCPTRRWTAAAAAAMMRETGAGGTVTRFCVIFLFGSHLDRARAFFFQQRFTVTFTVRRF